MSEVNIARTKLSAVVTENVTDPSTEKSKELTLFLTFVFHFPRRPASSSQGLYFALEQANKSTATTENDRLVNSLQ